MKTTTNKTIRKVLSIALCLALVMSYVPMTAFAAEGISYIDENGNQKTYTGSYTEVTSGLTTWSNGWYVVNGEVTISSRVTVSGTVNLILADGATLTASKGICVNKGNTFIIFAQSEVEAIMGSLVATGGESQAGIGGNYRTACGTVVINGGVVTATGGNSGAGIGGGHGGYQFAAHGGIVTINGGIVIATGRNRGAGIGGGGASNGAAAYAGDGGTLIVNDGYVVATGSGFAAGIGGGGTYDGKMGTGNGADVTINDGLVISRSGSDANHIGAGKTGTDNGTLTINGGMVIQGDIGAVYGNGFTLEYDIRIENNQTLTINEGQTLIVDEGATFINHGEVVNNGNILNYGVIEDVNNNISSRYENLGDGVIYREHTFVKGYCAICGEACASHVMENGFCAHGCADVYEAAAEVSDKYDVDGDGYTDQVYEIANAGQLYWFAGLVNGTLEGVQQNDKANAVLTADIVVNNNVLNDDYSLNGDGSSFRVWTPIGSGDGDYSFVFDGMGHTISGLYYNDTVNGEYVGLIGGCWVGSIVRNVGVIDTYFCGAYTVGAIVGRFAGKMENCFAQANIKGEYAGGIVGLSVVFNGNGSPVNNSWFAGKLSGPYANAFGYQTKAVNCYYDSSVYTGEAQGTGKTTEEFASGEVAYLLNNSSSDGIWKQTIGEDSYPNFNGEKVYYGYSCSTEEFVGYTNEKAHSTQPHYDENGYCAICKTYQPATLNADNYYEIYNVGQLYWFAETVSSYNNEAGAVYNAILMNDIVINENVVDEEGNLTANTENLRKWVPISNGVHTFYNGVFDGNYHTISGVYMDDSTLSYSALFGSLQNGAIKNLGITDSYIDGKRSSAFASWSNGTIENCFVTDTVIKGESADSFVVSYSGTNEDFDYHCLVKKSYTTAVVYENDSQDQSAFLSERISENSYYIADTDNGEGGKTAQQFAGGEVAYLLGSPWGQEIEKDSLPVWNGKIVYLGYDCGGTDAYYSNSELLGENDNNHIHSEWTYSDTNGVHQRYICTREGCPQYYVIETGNCYGGTATCQESAICSVCKYGYGAYDYNNHTSTKTYMTQGDENGHQVFNECCDTLISTIPHSYNGYDFDSNHHWNACECGIVNEAIKEAHSFDGNGFCTICGGYEPANVIFDEENYSYIAEIANAGQFFWYAKNYSEGTIDGDGDGYGDNVGGVLIDDIDLNPGYTFYEDGSYIADETAENYSPTLREWKPIKDFAWVDFDGQGHTVSGLYINTPDERNVAMFASNDYYTIKNITLTNGFVYGSDNTAAVVAYNTGNVENCHSDIAVKGNGSIGGIIAYHAGGEVKNCSNSGSVIIYGSSTATGGIVGNIYGYSTITNCYNTGYIKGGIRVGGIVGDAGSSTISNCFNTGLILSNYSDAHAISGGGTIENCYSLANEDNGADRKTKAQFESGEVTYLLQSAQPVSEIYDEETWEVIGTEQEAVWFQTIGEDALPTFDNTSLVVYRNITDGCCEENYIYEYSNTEKEPVFTHEYNDNGFCVCGEYEPAEYNETDDIYEIANAGQLYWFAQKVNGGENSINASLIADIIINETVFDENGNLIEDTEGLRNWIPIEWYYGNINGNGYTISGLYACTTGEVSFIQINYGTISELNVENSYLESTDQMVGFVISNSGTIINCSSDIILKAYIGAGGIAYVNNETISNCYYVGEYSESDPTTATGAIVAHNHKDISNCYYLATEETDKIDGTTFKTAEQFASGEVAYLLQQGNTEQVWGQDNNQTGAKPMFTSNELYKVVTVGETGNYSVANVGDTNGDGTVDVVDYQELVNKALADDQEQIETASYDDIVRYDLDGDGYLDALDASLMALVINGHKTIDVYAVGDYDLNGVAFEEADILAIAEAIEEPKSLATYKKYICDMNADGKVDYDDLNALTSMFPLYFVGEE